jgi:hypothetical protein
VVCFQEIAPHQIDCETCGCVLKWRTQATDCTMFEFAAAALPLHGDCLGWSRNFAGRGVEQVHLSVDDDHALQRARQGNASGGCTAYSVSSRVNDPERLPTGRCDLERHGVFRLCFQWS